MPALPTPIAGIEHPPATDSRFEAGIVVQKLKPLSANHSWSPVSSKNPLAAKSSLRLPITSIPVTEGVVKP